MNHMFVTGSAKAGNGFQAAQNLRAGDSKEQEAERLFSPVEKCRFQGGLWKVKIRNNAGVKCSVIMFWVDLRFNTIATGLCELSNKVRGQYQKFPTRDEAYFLPSAFFNVKTLHFSQCLHVFSPWLSDWLPHLQSLMNSGNTKRIWYWRSYHVKDKLRARTNICQLIAKKTPNFLATWLLFPP